MNTHEFVAEVGLDRASIVVKEVPEGATHFSFCDSHEYDHYVIVKEEWSALNKHGYFSPDKDTGVLTLNFMANVFHGYNLIPAIIELGELKTVLESIKIIQAMDGLDQAKLYTSLNDLPHTTVLIGQRISLERIQQAIIDVERIESYKS